MTKPGANSGVYFHTAWQDEGWPAKGYEVQVNNSQSDPKRTAGLYAVKDNYQAPAKDDVWFTLRIRVEGRRIRTFVDDKPISRLHAAGATRATGRHAAAGCYPRAPSRCRRTIRTAKCTTATSRCARCHEACSS